MRWMRAAGYFRLVSLSRISPYVAVSLPENALPLSRWRRPGTDLRDEGRQFEEPRLRVVVARRRDGADPGGLIGGGILRAEADQDDDDAAERGRQ
ncbi:hypothetical protein [Streptomyces sp. NPDC050982]|uniref:hypothetical protein n=1 Tax=Streptomyces sp. NPDC050982 TaxID=3154746 RepID=UPI0033BFC296